MRRLAAAMLGLLLASPTLNAIAAQQAPADAAAPTFSALEVAMEELRQILAIPGMSAAVVVDRQVAWTAGFGYADMEEEIPAAASTPYGLASVTKPIAIPARLPARIAQYTRPGTPAAWTTKILPISKIRALMKVA